MKSPRLRICAGLAAGLVFLSATALARAPLVLLTDFGTQTARYPP